MTSKKKQTQQNKPRQQELSSGYKTESITNFEKLTTTTINPKGGIGSIKMNNFPIKKRKGKDGQPVYEIRYDSL